MREVDGKEREMRLKRDVLKDKEGCVKLHLLRSGPQVRI